MQCLLSLIFFTVWVAKGSNPPYHSKLIGSEFFFGGGGSGIHGNMIELHY